MSDLKFSISASSETACRTIVKTPNFSFIIDEPPSLGGTNKGPNPVEYVIGALAGCLTVVTHLVAKEMGIEMRGIKIDIEGDLNPGKFSGASTEGRAGYHEIRVSLRPDCDADQDTLAKWLKTVEERCPVSDNLANPTPVKITISGS